ncbi:MAG: FkbM family methyltransferase [Planctomycetes bacterium]|nr:FkbM family methyltransferase [Planctomycetota bacterium]
MNSSTAASALPPPRTVRIGLRHRLLLAYVRHELPGWGRLYRLLGGERDAAFEHYGEVVARGKLHGFEMALDLRNWSERLTWFLGRYHDLPLQQALRRVLRPGDCFVDIGANLGMLSLVAAERVGERGRVLACEPNPLMIARITRTIAHNRLSQLQVVAAAIHDQPGEADLHEYAGHAGWGSLSAQGPAGADETASYRVACRTGDSLFAEVPPEQPSVIKVDVEGHEVPVLRSLPQTLATRRPLVFVEVADDHQRRAGFRDDELRAELARHGYRGFVLEDRRRWLQHGIVLRALRDHEPHEVDALFVPPDGPMVERVAQMPGYAT